MTDATIRNAGLKQMLCERRREMKDDVQSRIRDGRAGRADDGHDDLEHTHVETQAAIEFAVLEMRAATLTRIDQALARLDAGDYGRCSDCASEIAEERLRALPFATRCRSCEQRREHEQVQARQLVHRNSGLSLFANAIAP
jgi:RNA polymerase-binding transcription factor